MEILTEQCTETIKQLKSNIVKKPPLEPVEQQLLDRHILVLSEILAEKRNKKIMKITNKNNNEQPIDISSSDTDVFNDNVQSINENTVAQTDNVSSSHESIVFDLTNSLSTQEKTILEKGFTFCPTNNQLNKF